MMLTALRIFVILTVLTGVLYPLAVTGVAQMMFTSKANGSLIVQENKVMGSMLLAQKFQRDSYFWPRPSAGDYATVPSSASQYGPTHAGLKALMAERKERFLRANQLPLGTDVPKEMLFASGSGLDPHISVAAAQLQMDRVIRTRSLTPEQSAKLLQLVEECTEQRWLGVFGEKVVNVLRLNLALDLL